MQTVRFESVSKFFYRQAGQRLLRERVKHLLSRAPRERFYALRDVSFAVDEGESLGIMGHNGAGKSTLLNIATSLCTPSEGQVRICGRVAALLELGSGFHPDLTGEENIRINAALLGLTRQQTRERFNDIVEFAGIGKFIEEPLRTYSSGMVMRLAFSVAVNVDPDILIIDEMLAVGDQQFQEKCLERLIQFQRDGRALLCVSHVASAVQQLCKRAIWLDHGRVMMDGPVPEVAEAYRNGARVAC